MKQDNKKALYESIMTSVAKEVKKTLNEDFESEYGMKSRVQQAARRYVKNIGSNMGDLGFDTFEEMMEDYNVFIVNIWHVVCAIADGDNSEKYRRMATQYKKELNRELKNN